MQEQFARETARLRQSGVLGESGRLAELFDFLAGRGHDAASASQAEIAEQVFGQAGTDGDDATVRVYIHRLRKRLEEHYAGPGAAAAAGRLSLPSGTYALRFAPGPLRQVGSGPESARAPLWQRVSLLAGLALLALLAGWVVGRNAPPPPQANAFWQPFLESERPITLVVGDYYMFGEIDPLAPQDGRLIREFAINSATDLARAQEAEPERYGTTQEMGLTYLPLSSAHALREVLPLLASHAPGIRIVPASQLTSGALRDANMVYLGLISGMGLLEDVTFSGSSLMLGESYDELIDRQSRRRYVSEEARNLPSSRYYRDYGYAAAFRAPGGGLVAVVAGARDTGLRGVAQAVSATDLPGSLAAVAGQQPQAGLEALYEITGQQGADVTGRVVFARTRPGS